MCGHVGVAGNLAFKDEKLMKRLLLIDVLRGQDSTGLASIRHNGTKIAKIASHPLDLFDTQRFKDVNNGAASRVFIGHNRAATKGLVTAVNAHPFDCGNIVGAHNGTLTDSSQKELEADLGEKFGTDSEAIFQHIAKFGIEDTTRKLQGAWALVWYNSEEDTLNFLRNKERPFWLSKTKNEDRLFWASEWPMIRMAVELGKPDYELYTNKEGHGYFETSVDTHYKYSVADLVLGRPQKPTVKERKGKEPAPVSSSNDPFERSCHGGSSSGRGTSGRTTQTSTSTTTSLSANPKTVHLVGNDNDPYAGMLPEEKFMSAAKYGCAFCSATIEYGDVGLTYDESLDSLFCADCSIAQDATTRFVAKTDTIRQLI